MDLGERLKAIRKRQGISQRELAKRAGVTNSTISMIEKNTVSPSFSSLLKVLKGFPMSVEEFFTLDLVQSDQVVFRADEQADMEAQGVALKLIGHNVPNRGLSMLIETYPPGADTGEEMIKYDGEEAGTVIEGEVEITVDYKTYHLKTGDGYFFRTNLPHRFRNLGQATAVVVSANTGPTAVHPDKQSASEED